MAKRRVFYSFHYEKDVMRASQIKNIGVIEGILMFPTMIGKPLREAVI